AVDIEAFLGAIARRLSGIEAQRVRRGELVVSVHLPGLVALRSWAAGATGAVCATPRDDSTGGALLSALGMPVVWGVRDIFESVFHLLFRRPPFESGFTIAAGLATALEYIRELRFTDDDLRYLRELRADSGEPMFEPAFLDHLRSLELGVDVDAVPEGTAVFPQEPLLRVCGPIVPCMLLE